MHTIKIRIDTPQKVLALTSVLSGCDANCEVKKDGKAVNAKSIVAIFSLNLATPVDLVIHSDDVSVFSFVYQALVQNGLLVEGVR